MSDLRVKCTGCDTTLKIAANTTAKKIKCTRCGVVMPIPVPAPVEEIPEIDADIVPDIPATIAQKVIPATTETFSLAEDLPPPEKQAPKKAPPPPMAARDDDDEDDEPAKGVEKGRAVSNPFKMVLLVLLAGYFPFLGILTLGLIGAGIGLIVWGIFGVMGPDGFAKVFGIPGAILGVFLVLTALHVLLGLTALLWKVNDKDEFEIELPEEWQEGLVDLVQDVADERRLPMPDAVRLHAVSVAHIYQDTKNRSILVIGGMAIVALPKKAVAGIIAHELGHGGAGDTGLSRLAFRWHLVIDKLESRYAGRSWHNLNPFTWALRIYHWTYIFVWFANMRRAELAADQHEIELVGRKNAAATLVLVHVLGNMKGTDLASVAESYVSTNSRLEQIFSEQVNRIRSATKSVWEDALKKALRESTGWLDSHPCLKDRLDAIGVAPKKALKLAMDLSGQPATAMFTNWPLVEKFLTRKIVDIVREYYFARKDYVETVAAVMRASERAASG
jgi:Zn-dependent protease with chaperone function